jgi:VanZ family protein
VIDHQTSSPCAPARTPSALPPPWRHWYRRALPAYWVFLFCATHFPKLSLAAAPKGSDKVLHLVGFALLAFLFWRFGQACFSALGHRFVWLAAIVLLTYAATDEYLQRFVGRNADVTDWLFDAAGILIALLVLETLRRRRPAAHQV